MLIILDRRNNPVMRLPFNSVDERYQLLEPDGSRGAQFQGDEYIHAVGTGGFGSVVRAEDGLKLPRAIKFLKRYPDLTKRSADGRNLIIREIELANRRPYKHVVPIHDHGTLDVFSPDDLHTAYPIGTDYYISHFVDGIRLNEFFENLRPAYDSIARDAQMRDRLRDQLLTIINDVLSALVELDAARVVHMDIKPQNILVYPSAQGQAASALAQHLLAVDLGAYVIDLGAAKPVGEGFTDPTHLRYTPYYFPTNLLPVLGFNAGEHTIMPQKLERVWRQIDLFCTGTTLEELLLDRGARRPLRFMDQQPRADDLQRETEKADFWRLVLADDYDVVEGLVDSLLGLNDVRFDTAADARFAFSTIPHRATRSVLESEFVVGRDPRRRTQIGTVSVTLSANLQKIAAHPAFQRLRGVQQLAFTSDVYPDATHTRYAHSLRTYEMAKSAVLRLYRRSIFRRLFQRRDVEELLAAALLHDVGQYHFAHSLEDLRKLGDLRGDEALATIRHDQELISDVCHIPDGSGTTIEALLLESGLSPDRIYYMAQKTKKSDDADAKLNIGRDIISGLIDVDRLSYLTHDTERTGVPYGGAADITSLLDALTVRVGIGRERNKIGLGIEKYGVNAAESVLVAVYWMYRNVYWNPVNRAFMAAVKLVMMRLLRCGQLTFEEYRKRTLFRDDFYALRLLAVIYDRYLRRRRDVNGINPLRGLLTDRAIGFDVAWSLSWDDGYSGRLYDAIVDGITPDRHEKLVDTLRNSVPSHTGATDGELLLDIPLKRRLRPALSHSLKETVGEIGATSDLWVADRHHLTGRIAQWHTLEEFSGLAGRLGEIEDIHGREIRIFIHRRLYDTLAVHDREFLDRDFKADVVKAAIDWAREDGREPLTQPDSATPRLRPV
jgi:HD superfamily phosphohydrolase